ncbi:MAG: HAD-IIA family hydrolase, partial [Firmicutes bacterium]|nr:HAD-IIA family hydrolase [Bacillota bacterium]
DGTIYIDNKLIDGTLELLEYIKSIHGVSIFITNNSSKSVQDYIKKLMKLGIKATEKDFFTSSMATSLYLKEMYPFKKIYVMGTTSLVLELKREGLDITVSKTDKIDVVLIGFDTELTMQKLSDVCEVLLQDVAYLGTNPDLVCPVAFGYVPDCGSFAQIIKNATKKTPFFIGKPNPMMIDYAIKQSLFSKEETVLIGDRLYTDIASGKNANVTTICVLSGEATLKDIKESIVKPDFVYQSVKEILTSLKE